MFLLTNKTNLIVGVSILVIGMLFAILFFIFYWWIKTKNRNKPFNQMNRESQTIWEFTKKNFLVFFASFFLIMAMVGLTMVIKSA